jgi:hypothetical protein
MSCAMIVDLNADRRSDLVTLQAASNLAWIRRWVPPPGYNTNRPVLGESFTSLLLPDNTLQCTVPIPPANANRPPLATHLEVFLFGADPGTTSALSLQPDGLQRLRFAGAPEGFAFTENLVAANLRALIGVVRWIRIENGSTVNVWAPTRFAVAHNGMRVVLDAWHAEGAQQIEGQSNLWTPNFTGNNYVWRPMQGVSIDPPPPPIILGPPNGYEEPPDLPPPPVVPPTPPSPPPPDGGGG